MFNAVAVGNVDDIGDGGDADAARPCDVVACLTGFRPMEGAHPSLDSRAGGRYVNRANNIKIKQ
jgi:hypothetical protein